MKKLWTYIIPPDNWQRPVIIALGVLLGLGACIFHISNASSYLTDKPETCINCHVMNTQYATWKHSSHKEAATCVDCHVPHDNVFNKYLFKAKDGLRHATVFTLRAEPEAIIIKEEGTAVVQQNCQRCHSSLIEETQTLGATAHEVEHGGGKLCWDCHKEVPHGKVRSLSSTPNALVPKLESPVPTWLQDAMSDTKK